MAVAKGTTTIRIRSSDKRRLAALQDKWRKQRGEAVSQLDLVAKALSYVERHVEPFIEEEGWRPWTDEEIGRLRSLRQDWGVGAISDKIDDIVYGNE